MDWKKVVDLQDKQSYEKFLEIFEKCMSVLWAYRTDEALASIEQQCYSIGLIWSIPLSPPFSF